MNSIKKIVLDNLKNCKIESVLSMVFVSLETICEIIVPLCMARLIDEGINLSSFDNIKKYSLIIFVLVIFQVSFGSLCAKFAVKASTNFAYNLRENVFNKMQTFSFANIDKFSTGSLVTRATSDIINIKQSYQMVIRGAIRGVLMVIFSTIAMFNINKKIAKLLLFTIPFIFISFMIIAKLVVPVFNEVYKGYDEMNNILSENIRGIRVVKSFVREEYENIKFKNISDFIYKKFIKALFCLSLWTPVMNVAMYSANLCICYFGTMAIIESGNNIINGLTTGELMSLVTYASQMLMSLMMIAFLLVSILMSVASFNRINEVLLEDTDIKNDINPIKEIKSWDIEFKNVCFKYKLKAQKNVLSNINIKINQGENVGIIGATGSGKSSLVSLIPRLYDTISGEVLIGNIDVKKYDINSLRQIIGMVLQKNVLFSGTILSNMRFGNENATIEEVNEALEISNAKQFVDELDDNINHIVEQGGVNFSGGQRQRLCIARAIVKKPKIIIFDDYTASVDTETDKKIRAAIFEKLKLTTKIIISQKVLSIKDCDKIIVIDDGKIVDVGNNEYLLENCQIYKDIYELQSQGDE